MTYVPVIHDWPALVEPINQTFMAGGTGIDGGMTIGGATSINPEPGGRAELLMDFVQFALPDANLAASWIMSRLQNAAIMRIPLYYPSVQMITDEVLGISTPNGVNWSNNLPWSGGAPWRTDPMVDVTVGGAKGTTVVRLNTGSGLQYLLKVGHVIGFHSEGYDFAHMIVNATYFNDGARTEVTLNPPLRRTVTTLDRAKLRPVMLATCPNAREVGMALRLGRFAALNSARFVEALV